MKKSVFISYSTKDKETAAKVRKVLVEHGIDVTIDSESLDPGKDIRTFIDQAIRETQVTLSIVSENSLTSDWVALETLDSFEAEKYLEGKKFIACYVDARFFERAFVIEAVDQIDMEIKELEKLIRSAARKKLDATNLQTQKSRKYNLRNNLPKILDRLNRSLTLDIRGEGFDTSLQRIIDEIKRLPELPSEPPADPGVPTQPHQMSGIHAQGERSVSAGEMDVAVSGDVSGGLHITKNIYQSSSGQMKDAGEIDTLRAREIAYLEMLREEEKLDRTKYYTPLSGQSVPVIEPEYEYTPFQPIDFEDEGPRRFADAAGEILRLKRAVVLGEPGAGKTTTLWKLAGDMIEQVQANPKAPLPLLIRLGRWIEEKEPFTDFLRRQLVELGPFLDQLLKQNRAVLLLDGLNELPAGQRKRKTSEIRELLKSWPKIRVVISCRQLDYDENDLQMDRIEIVPLDPIRIRQFVCGYLGEQKGERLFWKLAGGTAQETYEQLRVNFEGEPAALPELFWIGIDCPLGISSWMWTRWIRVRENPSSLLVLARNPFMLTMLYSLYGKEDALPENRVILFDLFVRQLLKREKVAKGAQALILQQIARLAYEMQTRRTTEKQGDALTVVPRSEVLKTLDDRNLGIAVRASLVSPGEEVRFTHQLLQEYFAARHMDEEIREGRLQASDLWPAGAWWERNNWEVATTLLAGFYNDDCTKILQWVADTQPMVAARCIKESGAVCPPPTLEKLKAKWLPRLTDLKRDPDPRGRAAVGRALGMTGLDDRKGVGTIVDSKGRTIPDIDWVEMPAGDFPTGYLEESDNLPSWVRLDRFWIGRYPITYRQFQVFIKDPEGIRDKRWFDGLASGDKEQQPGEQAFPYDNHPRERVSWYQAVAFCRWLSWRLGGPYDLQRVDRWLVRLPTELEWERAARGTEGRVYAYGDEFDAARANTFETGIGQTSAVGIFPHGATPEGLMDMTGNVWEWCLNEYDKPQEDLTRIELGGAASRPLRGGSWGNDQHDARAVFRNHDADPNYRYDDVGLRLVSVVRSPS